MIARSSQSNLKIEMLSPHHDRNGFSCGVAGLDHYLQQQASQDVRRKANGVFILIEPDRPDNILGYYTLCATALAQGDVPATARKYIPRYPLVSATLIGWLAVSRTCQGQGLGAILLADAVARAYANADIIGSSMLIVDALDERAALFYESHGFARLPDSSRLILPMATIGKMA